jgi:hypothetical protein
MGDAKLLRYVLAGSQLFISEFFDSFGEDAR